MNFLMDLTAVDFSAFGTKPAPAFFASSGVAVRPSDEIAGNLLTHWHHPVILIEPENMTH
jgi:hypothetical protein